MWRFLVLLLAFCLAGDAQTSDFTIPASAEQGDTIRLAVRDGERASFLGRDVRLFSQPDGTRLGLMPVAVDAPPGTHALTIFDNRNKQIHSATVQIADAHFPKQNIVVGRGTKALKPLPGEMEAVGGLKNMVTDVRFWQEPFVSPTPDCMNSIFGVARYHNGRPTGTYHKGVDLRSPRGRPIEATTNGVVKIARMFRLHGGTVGLDHGQGLTSIYIHMSKLAVKEGQKVKKGEVIGYVGATGFATGPHLHWQLFANGLPVNPAQWIPGVPRCGK
jgi:hypothetical protein